MAVELDRDRELLWGVMKRGSGSSSSSSSEMRSMARLPSGMLITLNRRRRLLEELVAVPVSLPGSFLMVMPGSGLMSGTP